LAPIFDKRGGPFKYFFEKFDTFFHTLSTFYLENSLHKTGRVDNTKLEQQGNDQTIVEKPASKSENNHPSTSFSATNNKDTNHIVSSGNKNDILRIQQSRKPHQNQNSTCFPKKNQNDNYLSRGSRPPRQVFILDISESKFDAVKFISKDFSNIE